MRILHVTNSELGGANRAALRLHKGLLRKGIDSSVLVRSKTSDDPKVHGHANQLQKLRSTLAGRSASMLGKRVSNNSMWHVDVLSGPALQRIHELNPDVVNLHWLGCGFLPIADLAKIKPPVVWTCHDMAAFTGGCFYDQECGRYIDSCGDCPQLKSPGKNDISHRTWKAKKTALAATAPIVVCPSRWLAQCARNSSVLANQQIEVVPYGLDLDAFRPIDRAAARERLKLPHDKKIVLFGAASSTNDARKGFDLLVKAEKHLSETPDEDRYFVVFGSPESYTELGFGGSGQSLGIVNDDETLANIYAASDVFVAPSRQDNLPNTVLEAMACGTPVVAFRIGGMPDMIDHKTTGFLADPFESEQLAAGIDYCIRSDTNPSLQTESRAKAVAGFALNSQAERYLELYRSVLGTV